MTADRTGRWSLVCALGLVACRGEGPVECDPFILPESPDFCACNADHPFCDSTCDPLATDPVDFVADGGDCTCEDFGAAGVPLEDQPDVCVPDLLQPCFLFFTADFAHLGSTGELVAFSDNGIDSQPRIHLALGPPGYDPRYSPAEDLCLVELRPTATTLHVESTTIADLSAKGWGFYLRPGAFTAEPYSVGESGSCLDRVLDPAFADQGLKELLESLSWGAYVDPLWERIGQDIENGKANATWITLYQRGQLFGSTLRTTYAGNRPWGVATAAVIDDETREIVYSAGQPEILDVEQALPAEGGLVTAAYRAFGFYGFPANPLLNGEPSGGSPYEGCE